MDIGKRKIVINLPGCIKIKLGNAMNRFSKIIIKYRWIVIGLITVATIFFGWRTSKIGLNADFSTYLNQSNPLVERYNRIGKVFGSNSIGVALISSKDIFSEGSLQLIKKLTNAYKNIDGIKYVTSLTNVVDFKKTEWEIGRASCRERV